MNAHTRFAPEAALLNRARDAERRVKDLEAENERLKVQAARHEAMFGEASTLKAIIIATCEHFEIPKAILTGAQRGEGIRRPRQIAMYLARQMTPLSLVMIGRHFGDRDHTTVLHSVRQFSQMLANGTEYAADAEAIRRRVSERNGVGG